MMTYKNYSASIEFDEKENIFYGEVAGLRDVVTFEGSSVSELKKAFRDSVDDYLDFCRKLGEEPEKPFSGKFVVRLNPEFHRKIYLAAKKKGKSINAWINDQLVHAVEKK